MNTAAVSPTGLACASEASVFAFCLLTYSFFNVEMEALSAKTQLGFQYKDPCALLRSCFL